VSSLKVPLKNIEEHISALGKIGNLGPKLEDGFFRAPWSDEESAAIRYIADYAKERGLNARYDEVGNLFVRTLGEQKEILQVGSHLDTVPRGGLFDGGAGIIAGLEAILAMRDSREELPYGLELVVWRGEESAVYKSLYFGSRAAFGIAEKSSLNNSYESQTLEQAIQSQGFNTTQIADGRPTITQAHKDSIAAHLELHIEQATRLETGEKDIGIITSIRAPRRFRIIIRGESAHSGATPMGLEFRKDAVLALAHMNVRLDQAIKARLSSGVDLVQTVGVINSDRDFNNKNPEVYGNAMTKISEYSYFLLDIRGNEKSSLESYSNEALELIDNTAKEFGVTTEIETIAKGNPLESLDCGCSLSAKKRRLAYSDWNDLYSMSKRPEP